MLPSSTLSWIRENPAPAYNLLRTTNKFLVLCDGCSADVGRRRCLMPQFENMALIMSTVILCIFDGFVFIYSYSGFVLFSIFLFLINASHNFCCCSCATVGYRVACCVWVPMWKTHAVQKLMDTYKIYGQYCLVRWGCDEWKRKTKLKGNNLICTHIFCLEGSEMYIYYLKGRGWA